MIYLAQPLPPVPQPPKPTVVDLEDTTEKEALDLIEVVEENGRDTIEDAEGQKSERMENPPLENGIPSELVPQPELNECQEESEVIRKEFQKYFDLVLPHEDIDSTFNLIVENLEKLTSETQWVPRNWVYS